MIHKAYIVVNPKMGKYFDSVGLLVAKVGTICYISLENPHGGIVQWGLLLRE